MVEEPNKKSHLTDLSKNQKSMIVIKYFCTVLNFVLFYVICCIGDIPVSSNCGTATLTCYWWDNNNIRSLK